MRVAGMLVAPGLGLALLASPGPAHADVGRFEASGFIGVGVFPDDTELGNSWAAEQVPNTAPVLGARIGWLAIPHISHLGDVASHVALAVEAELSIATSFTGGYTGGTGRMSYFAPVFGWRAHGKLRIGGGTVIPHLVLGAGGETVASSSPFMAKETDPVVYWGPGFSVAVNRQWRVRIDVRHGIMPARDDGMSSTIEAQLGVSASFGLPTRKVRTAPPIATVPRVADDAIDTDKDGITDRLDLCPTEAETVNGIDDGDGCAEADLDRDGILAADKCPNEPEDIDGFEDEDGCPDPDNDGDGIEDVRDQCPLQVETRNGVDDGDGCPDSIPDNILEAIATAKTIRFEAGRARVTPAGAKVLKPLHLMLLAHPDVAITITGIPDKRGNDDLARRRAEAVKWHLVDTGITESRVDTAVGSAPARRGQPLIELTLRPK